MMIKRLTILFLFLAVNIGVFCQAKIEFSATDNGKAISTKLIGAFFEDINYGADGGLYAELIQNRSFEYHQVPIYCNKEPLESWEMVRDVTANATFSVEDAYPLNKNNTHYLKLDIKNAGSGVGISNSGFEGIAVNANAKYDFSVYVRSESKFKQPLTVQLVSSKNEVIGECVVENISNSWTKYEAVITASKTDANCQLHILTTGKGTLYFDMVSLFPQDTYKGRKNGLRKDLAEAVADMHPKFLRFPGGCVSHGASLDNAYRWKATIGDVAERTPNWNTWGYYQTYGLGFYEYFLFCEDMGAIPLPVIPVGISCQFRNRQIESIDKMGPWIDDAIDLIEFANGDVSTEWGKKRAEMGHPEPFNMEYICLGNEEDDIPEFRERFTMFVDTIRKYHPEIKIIGTSGPFSAGTYYDSHWELNHKMKIDAVDEHYYNAPEWFLFNNDRYDNFDRKGPKVFIGEYASRDDKLFNAIAEAAYLTGVERNADIIELTCYAPLFCREGNFQWQPDMIHFNNTQVSKTPSYYVQQLFGKNSGDHYIPSTVSYNTNELLPPADYKGKTGLGTWSTKVFYDDVKVVSDGKVLLEEDFSKGATNWEVKDGKFNIVDGSYEQSLESGIALSLCSLPINASSYTITLKAKKTEGDEGFLIPFAYKDSKNYYWLNIGGWGNTQHGVEKYTEGEKAAFVTKTGTIVPNVWYNIKIDVDEKEGASFYLNNELLFDIPVLEGNITASVTKDTEANELIVKVVNAGSTDVTTELVIKDAKINQEVEVTTLKGEANAKNPLEAPNTVVPEKGTFLVTNNCELSMPAYSIKVFRIKLAK